MDRFPTLSFEERKQLFMNNEDIDEVVDQKERFLSRESVKISS